MGPDDPNKNFSLTVRAEYIAEFLVRTFRQMSEAICSQFDKMVQNLGDSTELPGERVIGEIVREDARSSKRFDADDITRVFFEILALAGWDLMVNEAPKFILKKRFLLSSRPDAVRVRLFNEKFLGVLRKDLDFGPTRLVVVAEIKPSVRFGLAQLLNTDMLTERIAMYESYVATGESAKIPARFGWYVSSALALKTTRSISLFIERQATASVFELIVLAARDIITTAFKGQGAGLNLAKAIGQEKLKKTKEQVREEKEKQRIKSCKTKSVTEWAYSYELGQLKGRKLHFSKYTRDGNLSEEIKYKADGSVYEQHAYSYDKQGNLTERVRYEPNGKVERCSFDSNRNVVEMVKYKSDGTVDEKHTYTYDNNGNRTERILKSDGTSVERREASSYDGNGNRIEWISYCSDGSIAMRICYGYDINGNVIEEIQYDSGGNVEERLAYRYDSRGYLMEAVEYDSSHIVTERNTYSYDSDGNVTEHVFYDSNGSVLEGYTYSYDSSGHMVEEVWYKFKSDGNVKWRTTYSYDIKGNKTERITFDESNRISPRNFPLTLNKYIYEYYK